MSVESTISGIRVSGSWDDMADHAETVAETLDNKDVDGAEAFKDWKPEQDEDMDDVRERTIDHASIDVPDRHPYIERLATILQQVERTLYRYIMLKTSPQYFDADEVSARLGEEEMEVATSDDDARDALSDID